MATNGRSADDIYRIHLVDEERDAIPGGRVGRFQRLTAIGEKEALRDHDVFRATPVYDNPSGVCHGALERVILGVSKLGHLASKLLRHACCAACTCYG